MKDNLFGSLELDDDGVWQGQAKFPRFAKWGGALDEKDPPHSRPIEKPDRSPSKGQLRAQKQLEEIADAWGGDEGAMLRSVLARALRKRDAEMPEELSESEDDDDEDAERLRQGICSLMIDSDMQGSRPTRPQRAALEALLARGETLWDELLEESFHAYQRQLPVRRKWWRAIYADYLLDRRLPKLKSSRQFARLIRPALFRIKPAVDEKDASAEISLHMLATWEVDGVGVIIRDGRVAELGQVIDVVHTPPRRWQEMEHPVFGRLRRLAKTNGSGRKEQRGSTPPWKGLVHLDPLREFADIADSRAHYAHDRANADRPESRMAWEFAEGFFEIRIYTPPGQGPTEAQSKAWSAFKQREKDNTEALIDTVFEQYQETCQTRREIWQDRFVDDNVPVIKSQSGLRELIQLRHIHVHSPNEQGDVTIAFQFVAAYDYDGFSALWRNGEFVEWGTWLDAEFREMK